MTEVAELRAALDVFVRDKQILLGEKRMLDRQLAELGDKIGGQQGRVDVLSRAQAVFETLLDEGQNKILRMVEQVATAALSEVFQQDIKFLCSVNVKRGVQCLEFEVEVDGKRRDPRTGLGGGLVDVLGFILQFVLVKLTPNVAPVLVLDEPFRNVAKRFHGTLGTAVVRLAEATGVQIIMITHEQGLVVGDRQYVVSNDGTGATVSLVENDDEGYPAA